MIIVAAFLGCFALPECLIAVTCWREFPRTRLLASILLVVAPLQVLFAAFGFEILAFVQSPTNFDANPDWTRFLRPWVGITVLLAVIPGLLCVALAIQFVRMPSNKD